MQSLPIHPPQSLATTKLLLVTVDLPVLGISGRETEPMGDMSICCERGRGGGKRGERKRRQWKEAIVFRNWSTCLQVPAGLKSVGQGGRLEIPLRIVW